MLKSSKYKRCKLLKRKLGVSPGESFTCYGHTWIMQPNGDSIGEIHVDFHKVETASGRYAVLDEKEIKISIQFSNREFRRLEDLHWRYDNELESLNKYRYLTQDQEIKRIELKKLKLPGAIRA